MTDPRYDVIIIGGGLAGLTAALHLLKSELRVLLIEKNTYPSHKVCGEYISNEVLPYLRHLGFDPFAFGAKKIDTFQLTTHSNRSIQTTLPLGGFGMSRYEMDYQLYLLAKKKGLEVLQDLVTAVDFNEDLFSVTTKSGGVYCARFCMGAFGKRSNLDVRMKRPFIKHKAPYLAVKMHAEGSFPEDRVALHNFSGGYCGVSQVENGDINLCYITDYTSFKKHKDIPTFEREVLYKNTALKALFSSSKARFEQPLTISQISFETKRPVEEHILMCGDTAGMIHPLCGNGMSMAIRSAKIASELLIKYFKGLITSREDLEKSYQKQWKAAFGLRLKAGHSIAYLFRQERLATVLLGLLRLFPQLLPAIIRMTHGKPIKV